MVDTPMIPGARPAATQYLSRGLINSRDQLPADDKGRRIALDFNSASNPTPGVEIIVPDDITDAELEASKAYVQGVAKLFDKHGYDGYGVRSSSFHPGIKRRGIENKSQKTGKPRGVPNTFHTEPFFRQDEKAVEIFMLPEFQTDYVQLLNDTLRKIPDSVIMAPHTKKRQGTEFQYGGAKVTERSLGMSLMNQMFPGQEPTSEAEITRQQADPIADIIAADQTVVPVSLNSNHSANDSIGQKLTASSASARMLEMPSMSQALGPLFDATERMTLDIDTSPASVAQRVADYRRSLGQQVSSPPFVMF